MADSTVTYRAAWVLPIATPPVQNGAVAGSKSFGYVVRVKEEFAVEIASGVLELTGASGTGLEYALDRHWRNVRVHSLHDPARWKYVHLGNHTLRGTLPPRRGVLL